MNSAPAIRPVKEITQPENSAFVDLANAYENILNGITSMDELVNEKEKSKVGKKGNTQDSETRGLFLSLIL
jgi:hypothetical protein